jgi:hypothetical protein
MFRSSIFAISALAPMFAAEAVVDPAGGAGAVGSQPKSKTEAEKVTMEDGRVVEFAGKRKLLKETLIPGVTENYTGSPAVRFDFRNGKTRTYNLHEKLVWQFAAHGASQKIGDETAGEDDIDDMVLAVDEIIERLSGDNPEWTVKREGGGFAGVSILMRALMEHSGKDEATVKAFLKPKSHAEKMALRSHPPILAIVKRLEDEKAAKAAGAAKVNAGELLATL